MKKNYSYKFDVFQNDKNIDITLFQYGWEQCAPMHSYGPAKRNHYQMCIRDRPSSRTNSSTPISTEALAISRSFSSSKSK